MDPAELTLVELLALLEARDLSARELVTACLARVAAAEPVVRAFVVLTPERALAAADAADTARARGEPTGPLAGVPVALKDLYLTRGTPTTAGSRALDGHDPGVDAVVWQRLRAAGAGLLGKTTTHEFGYGTASGPTRNPWDPTRTPGGSSGGSAAALATRMVPVATGTDTGGSLRIPAAACGVSTLRPAPGRVPTAGVVPLAPSFDTAGPLARRLLDVVVVLGVLTGSCLPTPRPGDLTGVRIGLPIAQLWNEIDPGIATVCHEALRILAGRGAELVEIHGPEPDQGCFDTVLAAEALDAHRDLLTRADRYTPQVLRRVRAGEGITAAAYLDAQRRRRIQTEEWRELLRRHRLTAVAHPAIDVPPRVVDPARPPLGPDVRQSVPWSVVGFPVVGVPAGFDRTGLPVGLSLAGPPEREADLLTLGVVVDEEVRAWQRVPPFHGDGSAR
jgi:aspartyl-tRNA(Asn)/glutamyl-tRNA(Gln) amidotransferase subunit A